MAYSLRVRRYAASLFLSSSKTIVQDYDNTDTTNSRDVKIDYYNSGYEYSPDHCVSEL